MVSRKCIKILKSIHTPTTQVELSFKNSRISIFVRKGSKHERPLNTANTQTDEDHVHSSMQSNSTAQDSTSQPETRPEIASLNKDDLILDRKQKSNNSKVESKLDLNENTNELNQINKESLVNKFNEEIAIDLPDLQKQQSKTDSTSNENVNNEFDELENEKLNLETNEPDEEIDTSDEERNPTNENNSTLNEKAESTKIDNLADDEPDEERSSINILGDSHHYVKMNSIESTTTDAPFNHNAESYFCTLPDQSSSDMNFYLDILRYVLGKLVVDRLPDSLVTFLKIKLLVSVHLVVFVLLIGIIWLISYFITFIYLAIDNKTKLKNQLCELQAQLSTLKNEKQLIKKSTTQAKQKEFEQERLELEKTIDDMLNEKLKIELELGDLKNKIKSLNETTDEIRGQKERLKKDLKEEMLAKSKLDLSLNEKLKKLESEHDALNNYCNDLKNRRQTNENKIEIQTKELADLNELLKALRAETKEKDNEIEYLNRMYEELKEQRSRTEDSNRDEQPEEIRTDQVDQANQHELTRLRHDIEKMQKERDEFRSNCEQYKSNINRLEEEIGKFEEYKTKSISEKEDAERYVEFSKKYLREKEDELQLQMQTMKDELEQTKKLYLNSEKYSSDYWKENQTLKNDLNLLRRDNDQLRKQIVDLMQEDKNKIPLPPEMPPALLSYLRHVTSPTSSIQQPQSPSNQSQISDYYLQQQHQNNYSANSLSHQSFTTSPTHSLTNLSLHSNSMHHPTTVDTRPNNSQHTSPKSNYSFAYPNLQQTQQPSIYSPTLQTSSTTTSNEHNWSNSSYKAN